MKLPPPISDTGLQDQVRETVEFNNLPQNVQQYFDDDFSIKIPGRKQNSPFGKINKNIKTKKITTKSGKTSYTFSLITATNNKTEGTPTGYYFDNLVVYEESNKADNPVVVRYEPNKEWTEGNQDFKNYLGKITFFNLDGLKINKIEVASTSDNKLNLYNKEVCYYYLEKTAILCVESLYGSNYQTACVVVYYFKKSCSSGSIPSPTDGGGDPGTGPTDPESIPTEPTPGEFDTGTGSSELITNSDDDCLTKIEDVKLVFPNTDNETLKSITDLINIYSKKFGIDTKEKLQHFLAQAGHESTNYAGKEFSAFEENLNYRIANLGTKDFGTYFNSTANPTLNSNKANPNDFIRSSNTLYVDKVKFANYVYNDINRSSSSKLGNTNTGDGYKYRGRGIIQLTGRYNYNEFNNYYRQNFDSSVNLINNPDLLATDLKIAVISALYYFKNNVMNNVTITSTTTVEKVTKRINSGLKGLSHRKTLLIKTKLNIDCI